MTIIDPVNSVSDKPKHAQSSKKTSKQSPHFTSHDHLQVENNIIPDFYNEAEEKYLNRIKLRAKLQKLDASSVPAPSTYEATLRTVNSELNTLYAQGDDSNAATARSARANLEILYAKFGTTNLFNIASSIATSRLQKQSIAEYDALIKNPTTAVDSILGSDTINNARKSKLDMQKVGADYYIRPSILGGPFSKAQLKAAANATPE